jgi:hypothetical protein
VRARSRQRFRRQYSASPENAGEKISALLAGDPLAIGAVRIDTGDLARHPAIRETFLGGLHEGQRNPGGPATASRLPSRTSSPGPADRAGI